MVDIGYTPSAISTRDAAYIRSGVWRCKKSPTGAHHWVSTEIMSGKFTCKHCGEKRKFPVTYNPPFKGTPLGGIRE